MSIYALVENGAVTYVGAIPVIYKNISGFDKIQNNDVYKTYGFYPYEYIQASYDGLTQTLGDTSMDIQEDKVVGTREILNKSQADIDSQDASMYLQAIHSLKDILFATDWVQVSDSGLAADQLAAYAAMRASINSVIANQKGQDVSSAQLYLFKNTIQTNLINLRDRNPMMPSGLVTLKVILDALV